jgi:hypothetical protein
MFDSRLRATAKIRLTLLLLFPIFIVEQIYSVDLRHRFSKERYNFTIKDFVEAEAANTFPEGISYDSSCEPIEGAGNVVSVNFRVSFVRVRPIFQSDTQG